jgi:hypothetical protein
MGVFGAEQQEQEQEDAAAEPLLREERFDFTWRSPTPTLTPAPAPAPAPAAPSPAPQRPARLYHAAVALNFLVTLSLFPGASQSHCAYIPPPGDTVSWGEWLE